MHGHLNIKLGNYFAPLSVTNPTDVLIPPTALRASKDIGAEYA
jgi:hypothetical protein